jgi:hypothetical protein
MTSLVHLVGFENMHTEIQTHVFQNEKRKYLSTHFLCHHFSLHFLAEVIWQNLIW